MAEEVKPLVFMEGGPVGAQVIAGRERGIALLTALLAEANAQGGASPLALMVVAAGCVRMVQDRCGITEDKARELFELELRRVVVLAPDAPPMVPGGAA